VKQNLIRTIDLIGKALHPDHLKNSDFVFSKKGDLINHLLVRDTTSKIKTRKIQSLYLGIYPG